MHVAFTVKLEDSGVERRAVFGDDSAQHSRGSAWRFLSESSHHCLLLFHLKPE